MSEFGDLLKHFRQRARLSQSALAEAANIDKSYVSKLESGRRKVASRSLALDLAQVLGLSPSEVERWLISAGYVSPRVQARVARQGVSWLWEENDAEIVEFRADSEVRE